ncbi:FliH/SctL family protein [Amnibacterium sp. CER49]|uniref:FliH/SctL family protein n=1 Tax=Amnibacterium sp. CER49 TaxID=3039161 RepID=UPI002449B82E|nr:FliH/SctL family protein [Amnibacterium sp. CER49]MDH2443856.1 FliH/SctL family protein [Amnibacterium sp. CER49]
MSTDFAPLVFPSLVTDEVSETVERARVQGHAAGYAAGRREAAGILAADRAAQEEAAAALLDAEVARVRAAAAALTAAASGLHARTNAALVVHDDDLLAAAVTLATALVGHELADTEGAAVAAVRRALAAADPAPVVTIRLAPEDLEVVAAVTDVTVPLEADPGLQRGDAVAVLADGLVDARIGAAVERLRALAAGTDR